LAVAQDVESTVAEHRIEPLIVVARIPPVDPVPVVTEVARDEEVAPYPPEGVLTRQRAQMATGDQRLNELCMQRLDIRGRRAHDFFGIFSSVSWVIGGTCLLGGGFRAGSGLGVFGG
jgi:hypothetical protein